MAEIRLRDLFKKYLEGKATPEERKLVDDWYERSRDQKNVRLSESERVHLRHYYWSTLKKNIRRSPSRKVIVLRTLAVAASVSAIVCAAVFHFYTPKVTGMQAVHTEVIEKHEFIQNKTDAVRTVKLADNSLIKLSPGSSVRVSPLFNIKDREIELSGEAFFDIARDENKPFYVRANEVTTRVLGTSFTVRAYPDDPEVTVAVKSGSVSVYAHREDKGVQIPEVQKVVLSPNQQAVYKRSAGTVSRMLVEEPEVVIPEEEVKKIRFEGVPVSEIFKALEKMYGVDIEFEEANFARCTMTTSARGEDLYERIDVICEITGATYAIDGTQIRITGTGCN